VVLKFYLANRHLALDVIHSPLNVEKGITELSFVTEIISSKALEIA